MGPKLLSPLIWLGKNRAFEGLDFGAAAAARGVLIAWRRAVGSANAEAFARWFWASRKGEGTKMLADRCAAGAVWALTAGLGLNAAGLEDG